jgi:ribosomal protein L37AE/L43A
MNEIERLILKSQTPPIRNRICEYCKMKFYANHLNKIFCCKKCGEKNYNEKIRPFKLAMKLLKKQELDERKMAAYKNSLELHENILKRNIGILKKLTLDPIVGTIYLLKEIADLGFNFKVYSFREEIPGKVENAYFLFYGNYRITKLDYTSIKIETMTTKTK